MYNYVAPCIVYSKSGHLVYCVLYVLIVRNTYQYVLRIVQPCAKPGKSSLSVLVLHLIRWILLDQSQKNRS